MPFAWSITLGNEKQPKNVELQSDTITGDYSIKDSKWYQKASNSEPIYIGGELKITENKIFRNQNSPDAGGVYMYGPITLNGLWYKNYNPAEQFMPHGLVSEYSLWDRVKFDWSDMSDYSATELGSLIKVTYADSSADTSGYFRGSMSGSELNRLWNSILSADSPGSMTMAYLTEMDKLNQEQEELSKNMDNSALSPYEEANAACYIQKNYCPVNSVILDIYKDRLNN